MFRSVTICVGFSGIILRTICANAARPLLVLPNALGDAAICSDADDTGAGDVCIVVSAGTVVGGEGGINTVSGEGAEVEVGVDTGADVMTGAGADTGSAAGAGSGAALNAAIETVLLLGSPASPLLPVKLFTDVAAQARELMLMAAMMDKNSFFNVVSLYLLLPLHLRQELIDRNTIWIILHRHTHHNHGYFKWLANCFFCVCVSDHHWQFHFPHIATI
jgi:hypothetical protein